MSIPRYREAARIYRAIDQIALSDTATGDDVKVEVYLRRLWP